MTHGCSVEGEMRPKLESEGAPTQARDNFHSRKHFTHPESNTVSCLLWSKMQSPSAAAYSAALEEYAPSAFMITNPCRPVSAASPPCLSKTCKMVAGRHMCQHKHACRESVAVVKHAHTRARVRQGTSNAPRRPLRASPACRSRRSKRAARGTLADHLLLPSTPIPRQPMLRPQSTVPGGREDCASPSPWLFLFCDTAALSSRSTPRHARFIVQYCARTYPACMHESKKELSMATTRAYLPMISHGFPIRVRDHANDCHYKIETSIA